MLNSLLKMKLLGLFFISFLLTSCMENEEIPTLSNENNNPNIAQINAWIKQYNANYPPSDANSINTKPVAVIASQEGILYSDSYDDNNDFLQFFWTIQGDIISNEVYILPGELNYEGEQIIRLYVFDGEFYAFAESFWTFDPSDTSTNTSTETQYLSAVY